jgi:chemotaxis protein CheD
MSAAPMFEAAGLVPEIVRERRFLQPGQLHVATKPTAITTILGSCVAVCLWDPVRHIGGMNHYMLPHPSAGNVAGPRFGAFALEELLTQVRAAGGRLPFLRARVFGGACMFQAMQAPTHLGVQNVDLALDFLSRRAIEVVEVETGGNRGRKLVFFTDEGSACLNSI